MSFGKRIKQYIDYKGFNVSAFEKESTLKNGAISRVIKHNTSLNGESIATLGKIWKDLNLNWLMNGDGEMLLDNSIINEPVKKYKKDSENSNEINWCKDALKRADDQIETQKDMIDALKLIIEKQEIRLKELE